ncbi:MAG: bifunctional diguanylate cyclase/phosphodiesterase [Anaerovoracaceae bacterium]
MTWNVAPECISGILLLILIIYLHQGVYVSTTRDRMFRFAAYVVLLSITVNLISTYMIHYYEFFPHSVVMAVTSLYYVLTPMIPLLYLYYTISILYYNYSFARINKYWHLMAIPYILYLIVLLLNPFLHNVFCILPGQGYVQEEHVRLPYVVFFLYCLFVIILTLITRKRVEKKIYRVPLFFVFISLLFIIVQSFMPEVMLTGTAGFTTIFILYLYLQNHRLSADELTGLLNRNMLYHILENGIKTKSAFSFFVISLQNFKGINGRLGMKKGDAILLNISKYLCANFPQQNVYRYSGDEFAVLTKATEKKDLEKMIEAILQRFSHSWDIGGVECLVEVRVALVNYPKAGTTAEALINAMDYTLADAKKHDSGQLHFYDEKTKNAMLRKQGIQNALQNALENDGFELHYQPIWSVKKQCFDQAEALLRLKPTEMGALYPDEFIPIAEESGLIVDITYLVLEKSCALLNKLDRLGDSRAEFKCISVNFPFMQFMQNGLQERILEILNRHSLSPERLKIEITERTLVEDFIIVKEFMKTMGEKGVRFGLDDFGVGYSNIETLLLIPFDVIKMDRSLVWSTASNENFAKFFKHMVNSFIGLGRNVVAEGVETEAQLNHVINSGCQEIQGYYFAKPMPEDTLVNFLLSR